MKEDYSTSMKPFSVEKNTPPVSAQFFLNIDYDIETLLKDSSEKIIEPLPREKFSSKVEFDIAKSELAEI